MKNLLLLVLIALSFSLKAQDSTQMFPKKNNLFFGVGIPLLSYLYPPQLLSWNVPALKNIRNLPSISVNYERRLWQKKTWALYSRLGMGFSMYDLNMSPDFGSNWQPSYGVGLGINLLHRFKQSPHILTVEFAYSQGWAVSSEGSRGKVPKDSQFLYENGRVVGIIVGNSSESILFDDTRTYHVSPNSFGMSLGYRWQKIASPYFFSFTVGNVLYYSDQLSASLPIKANNSKSLNKEFGGFGSYPSPSFSFGYSF